MREAIIKWWPEDAVDATDAADSQTLGVSRPTLFMLSMLRESQLQDAGIDELGRQSPSCRRRRVQLRAFRDAISSNVASARKISSCDVENDQSADRLASRSLRSSRLSPKPNLIQPTIIYDSRPPFRRFPSRSRTIRTGWSASRSYIGGFEIGNAFSELNDPVEQHKRFEQQLAERAARRRRSAPDGRGLRARAGLRVAAHGRRRHRHRPAGDAADRIEVDSGCDSLSADAERQGTREQGTEEPTRPGNREPDANSLTLRKHR